MLYVDDILIIDTDVGTFSSIKRWLSQQFDMKDLGEVNYILGIHLFRDRKKRMLALSQAIYIDKMIEKFAMQEAKKGQQPLIAGLTLVGNPGFNGTLEWQRKNNIFQKNIKIVLF